jgi:recombinational DNA repair protein (RecF pathway)
MWIAGNFFSETVLIFSIYAPTEVSTEEEEKQDEFYEQLTTEIKARKAYPHHTPLILVISTHALGTRGIAPENVCGPYLGTNPTRTANAS